MTAADLPPNRAHLAAMLKVFALSPTHFGHAARRELIEYIGIAEDAIEHQAAMLHADAAELANRHRVRRELVDSIDGLAADNARLKAQNVALAELAKKALDALDAGQQDDGEAISIIRAALEGTS